MFFIIISEISLAQDTIYRQDTGFLMYRGCSVMYFLPVKTYFDNKSLETIKNTDFKIGISFWHETWDSLDVENWKSF